MYWDHATSTQTFNKKPTAFASSSLLNSRFTSTIKLQSFDKSLLYNFKHDRRTDQSINLYSSKEDKKKFFNTYESKKSANLKFVMSDMIKTDYIDRSVSNNGSKAFGKISLNSVMTNSDLQKIIEVNSRVYNKAKQLIKI